MSSCSPSSSKEFNEQSLKPITPLTQTDPPTKPANPLVIDEDGKADEEDQMNPERTSLVVSVEVSVGPDVSSIYDGMLTSPSYSSRRTGKRKKGKGGGSYKKKQAIEKKLQTLMERLNLVAFIPSKALDFAKNEMILKSLGLWNFVSIGLGSDFNKVRSDLVAQLIATYDSKSRCSYVNDVRIKVNRADLARAFKLPLKKEKTGNLVANDAGDLDLTALSSESSVAFLEDFVSNWVILNNNEELWIMPEEVVNFTKPIKDGHPEKMDWSTLFWFMVEQELMLGEQLVHCNYASHLQHLIRSQRENLLSMEPGEGVTSQETETVLQERDSDKLILMEEPKIGETCEEEVLEKKDDGDEEEVKGQDEEEKVLKKKDDHGDEEEVKGLDKEEKVLEKKDDGDEEEVLGVKSQDTLQKALGKKNDDEELLEKDQGKEEEVLETENGVKQEVLETEDGVKEEVLEMKEDDGEEVVLEKKDDGDEETVLEKDRHKDEEVLEMKDVVEEEALQKKDDSKEEDTLEKKDDAKEEEVLLEKNDNGNEGAIKADEVREVGEEENNVKGEPRVELTLGQELMTEEVSKVVEMVDFEQFNYDHVEQDQSQWLLNGKNTVGEHFLQRCSTGDNRGSSDCIEENNNGIEEGEEGMVAEHGFDVLPAIDEFEGEGLDVNFLGTMGTAKLTYGSQGSLGHHSSVDIMDSQNDLHESGPSFYHNNGKRKVQDDVRISRHADDNKRLRTEQNSSDHQTGDFVACMEKIQFFMDKAKTMYMEKVEDQEHSNINQQILFDELQKRDAVIERLHQTKQEEIEKRDLQIYRLNRELFLMCSLLDDYKKALKQTDKAFDEYRQKNQQFLEEPMYKDVGDGGLVLSITDIEKRRQKEENRVKSEIEQKAKEAEEAYAFKFQEFLDKVNGLDKKLSVFENEFKSLKDSFSRPK